MQAIELYQQLEKDFITPEMSDDWAAHMGEVADFLSDNFKQRSMGLVCDFAREINKVYTAVFPEKEVLQRIIADGAENAMLFVHHPSIWDIRKAPQVFSQMDRDLLTQFKEKKISIYNLHVPLDNYGPYSTSATLANTLGLALQQPFAPYFGGLAGVFGKTDLATVAELRQKFAAAVGHEVSCYDYGEEKIKDGVVAVVAGGGNSIDILEDVARAGVNTFVTGITACNSHSQSAHDFAREHKINILGGTHYSTETFACLALVDYFTKLGLPAEFIAGQPVLEDL
jgi:putative NIF3 family GTP cyclohydrolase 1 type 2